MHVRVFGRDNESLTKKSMKSFRHFFATRRADIWPLHKLQRVMGHTDIKTTELYLNPQAAEMRDDFRALPPTISCEVAESRWSVSGQ